MMMKTKELKRLLLVLLLAGFHMPSGAQIPAGYYNSAAGLSGYTLKTALYNIIKDHTVVSYNSLYSYYPRTDSKPGNKVWDIYSDVPGGTPPYVYYHTSGDQCGSYNSEGDCYNREHSFPASWFNDASPMYSDLFNVIPTDGYVNNRRSNYPYAEAGTAVFTSLNGSKLGYCSYPGWTELVFEPIDEYKGDVARSVFYMATRYENLIAGWKNNPGASCVLAGNSTAVFWQWYVNQLIDWHVQDPVSSKEIARNDSVYRIQDNRNPFIDHPEWVEEIWTSTSSLSPTGEAPQFRLYPNPVIRELFIESSGEEMLHYVITDPGGRIVTEGTTAPAEPLNLGFFEAGIYFITVSTRGVSYSSRFVKLPD